MRYDFDAAKVFRGIFGFPEYTQHILLLRIGDFVIMLYSISVYNSCQWVSALAPIPDAREKCAANAY